jgi:Flp pilus assembly protein TadG
MLVGIPLLFIGAGMAVDFTRVVVAARQVSNATEASALAGAFQFQPGKAQLDLPQARSIALDTYTRAQQAGQMPLASNQSTAVSASATQVTVTTTYDVPALGFLHYFGVQFHGLQISRTAYVCLAGTTSSECARPGHGL